MDDPRPKLTIAYDTRITNSIHLVVNVGGSLLHLGRTYTLVAGIDRVGMMLEWWAFFASVIASTQ